MSNYTSYNQSPIFLFGPKNVINNTQPSEFTWYPSLKVDTDLIEAPLSGLHKLFLSLVQKWVWSSTDMKS